jgi:DNA polymerase phi
MRTFINHLSAPDRYLHKIARQVAGEIQAVVKQIPTLGLTLVLQLTGVNGSQHFDRLTKTKTVESILAAMDIKGIEEYVDHMLHQLNAISEDE